MHSPLRPLIRGIPGVLVCAIATTWLIAADPLASKPADVVVTMKPWQKLIGEWRGIGQPKRGSNKDTWQETASVVWKLSGDARGVALSVTDGKLWQSARLSPGEHDQRWQLEVQLDPATNRVYTGTLKDERLVLESAVDPQGEVHRITLSWLGNDRAIWLFEKRLEQQSFYQRVAEVAWQRQGTKLAAKDGSGPECVVTGGLGTIAVMYEGKTYYVCCTGCRDAFNDDPKSILAEYVARKNQPAKQ